MSDWSRHPERQVPDPGYVYDETEVFEYAIAGVSTVRRPWSIAPYGGFQPRPPRLGPHIG